MTALETCVCCTAQSKLDQGICALCALKYGPRVARLLGRCQVDAEFASSCLARLPEPARTRFAAALSAKCLTPNRGPGLRYTRGTATVNSRASA
jgi:hypothetical protein